ncbi:unnamed protein product, partial [Brachionus calyciflorus]
VKKMDPDRLNETEDEEREKFEISLADSIKNESDKQSTTSSIKNVANLKEELASQMENYYNNNRVKFMQQAIIKEDTEANHEESFKSIFRFSKRQANKLENKLNRGELPKFKHKYLEDGDERLIEILNQKNLKNRKFKKHSLDSDSDDDHLLAIEDEKEDKLNTKPNLNEELAKKFAQHCEKIKMRTNLLQMVYKKALQNQQASQKLIEMNSLEKFNARKMVTRPKTSMKMKKSSASSYPDEMSHNGNFYLTRPKTSFREFIPEKSNFDVSRNVSAQNRPFRLAKNELNSQIEVFKPIDIPNKPDLLERRPKTTPNKIKRKSHSFLSSTPTSVTDSTLLSTSLTRCENSSKGLNNYESLNQKPIQISINIQDLIKNSKIMESKCLSTFWVNYNRI